MLHDWVISATNFAGLLQVMVVTIAMIMREYLEYDMALWQHNCGKSPANCSLDRSKCDKHLTSVTLSTWLVTTVTCCHGQIMEMNAQNIYLCIWQSKGSSYFVPVCWRQIFLVKESLLQLKDLVVGEGCAGFPLLLWRLLVSKGQLRPFHV